MIHNSLNFPWPWKKSVFHWRFPDRGNPVANWSLVTDAITWREHYFWSWTLLNCTQGWRRGEMTTNVARVPGLLLVFILAPRDFYPGSPVLTCPPKQTSQNSNSISIVCPISNLCAKCTDTQKSDLFYFTLRETKQLMGNHLSVLLKPVVLEMYIERIYFKFECSFCPATIPKHGTIYSF